MGYTTNTDIYCYIVEAVCGHVGREYAVIKNFAIMAGSSKEAAAVCRDIPRVKHHFKYAIKNFHKESENLYVFPILIATDARPYNKKQFLDAYPDKQIYLQRENIESLVSKVHELTQLYGDDGTIDFEKWFNSPYFPTPTIIAAAVEAYKSHDLTAIAKSEAGQEGVLKCETSIYELIDMAQKEKKKKVCFVTGVPGAGKTLVGLDVVARNEKTGFLDSLICSILCTKTPDEARLFLVDTKAVELSVSIGNGC